MVDENPGGMLVATGTVKKQTSADDVRGSLSLAERNLPRICIWESNGEACDILRGVLGNIEASMFYRTGSVDRDMIKQFRRNLCFFAGEVKRTGQTTSKAHKNYDLMLSLQLGIRHSARKNASKIKELDMHASCIHLWRC